MAPGEKRLLIVDDDELVRNTLGRFLEREGYRTAQAETGEEALSMISREEFKLMLADVRMPGMDGIELLKQVEEISPGTVVVLVTGFASVERAVEAIKLGAFNYLEKPIDLRRLMIVVRNAMEKAELEERVERLSEQVSKEFDFGNMIGKSLEMLKTLDMVRKVARSDANVLITGESGTGKELVARSIHSNSERSAGPFVPINCTAITETLFEAELFGHEKGAFTGAVGRRDGYLKKAEGGTLFLDEIGDLPYSMQSKLLRAIEEKQFQRVGSTAPVNVDVRFVSATNKDIEKTIRGGHFREDLFYRLNVVKIELPPLRRRRGDIPLLTRHFLKEYGGSMGKPVEGVSLRVARIFGSYPWPGNIRELKNVVQSAVAITEKNVIDEEDIPDEIVRKAGEGTRLELPCGASDFSEAKRRTVDSFERRFIVEALKRNRGNVKRTAEEIGLVRTALQRLLKRHGIRSSDFKKK